MRIYLYFFSSHPFWINYFYLVLYTIKLAVGFTLKGNTGVSIKRRLVQTL